MNDVMDEIVIEIPLESVGIICEGGDTAFLYEGGSFARVTAPVPRALR